MGNKTRHKEFKTALSLFGLTINEFSKQLVNPHSGKKGVSHTAVIQVSKYREEIDWIDQEIDSIINKAYRLFPEYYKKRNQLKKVV
jgi:hypothetical protein